MGLQKPEHYKNMNNYQNMNQWTDPSKKQPMSATGKSSQRLGGYDFIRAVAVLGIFLYHFLVALNQSARPVTITIAGRLVLDVNLEPVGYVFVTVFFMLSGALLHHRYRELENKEEILTFYKKRALSLFPPFYLLFGVLFIRNVIKAGRLFYMGTKWTLLLTFVGMDGYLSRIFDTYYLVGEWFLGAIILLYLLYPLVLWLYNRLPVLTTLAIAALYVICVDMPLLSLSGLTNLPSSLLSFFFGMLVIDFLESSVPSMILAIFLAFATWKLNELNMANMLKTATATVWGEPLVAENIVFHMAGISLFLFLREVGRMLDHLIGNGRSKVLQAGSWCVRSLGSLSYYIYLVHHVIILKVVAVFAKEESFRQNLPAFVLALTLSIVSAWILKKISAIIMAYISQFLCISHKKSA